MVALLLYIYSFIIPLFDRPTSGDSRDYYLMYIISLAVLGVISAIYRFSTSKVAINKFFVLCAIIIGFGFVGALAYGENILYFRYSFSMVFLYAIMLLVYNHLSYEQVTRMFLFYGAGLLVGAILGGMGEWGMRLSGDIVSAGNVGIMPPIIIAICLNKILQSGPNVYKGALLGLGSFLIYLSAFTQSRINFVLLCLVGLYFFIVCRNRFRRYRTVFSVFFIIILATVGIYYYQTFQYRFQDPISTQQISMDVLTNPDAVDYSILTRVGFVLAGVNIFIDNPLGVGFGNFTDFLAEYNTLTNITIAHPHNTYIEILVSTGIGGTLCALFLVWYLFQRLKGDSFMQLILVLLLVAGLSSTLIYDKMLFLLFASRDVLASNSMEKSGAKETVKA